MKAMGEERVTVLAIRCVDEEDWPLLVHQMPAGYVVSVSKYTHGW
jgi:hypothetical protein